MISSSSDQHYYPKSSGRPISSRTDFKTKSRRQTSKSSSSLNNTSATSRPSRSHNQSHNSSSCSTIPTNAETAATMASLTRLEISVQSLHGLDLTSIRQGDGSPSSSPSTPIVCTVGFSGSSENMQVGSSTLCIDTGRLVVESDPYNKQRSSSSFRWTESRHNPPHVTVFLDTPKQKRKNKKSTTTDRQNKHAFTIPLTKINRDSKLVMKQTSEGKITPTKEDNIVGETSSWEHHHHRRHSCDDDENLIWGYPKDDDDHDTISDDDDEAASLPEILEISIRVKDQAVGVAFFVFFGHDNPDDPGTYILDLPVRKPAATSKKQPPLPILTDQTKLRIKVTVTAPPSLTSTTGSNHNKKNSKEQREEDDEDAIPNLSYCSTASSSFSSPSNQHHQLMYTRSMLEDQVDPLMQKLRQHEYEAMRFRQTQKRAIDVVFPNPNNNSNVSNSVVVDDDHDAPGNKNNNKHPSERQRASNSSSSAFCQGIVWNWSQIRETLEAAVHCGGDGSAAAIRFPKFMGDDASLDSTIATRQSWDI